MLNDVVFSIHAMFATIIIIYQCYAYEVSYLFLIILKEIISFLLQRGEQKLSRTATGLIGIFAVFVIVSAILAATAVVHWLDFLYYCSYIKLTITIIKYVPQVCLK